MIFKKPNHIENNFNSFVILKFFGKKEHMNDFLNGKLYFNSGDYFSQCEKEGVGDCEEHQSILVRPTPDCLVSLNFEIINSTLFLVPKDYTQNPNDYKPINVINYSAAENRTRKLICFYALFLDINNNIIRKIDKKMKNEFGDYAVLIHNTEAFQALLFKALNENSNVINHEIGFVEYINEEEKKGILGWSPFKKDKNKYCYQNELRISLQTNDRMPFVLELNSSLKKIAHPIDVQSLLTEPYMKDGKLFYKILPAIEGE